MDPTDLDPVDVGTGTGQYSDLYRRDPDGTFVRVTRGSLALPVPTEVVTFLGASRDLGKVVFGDDRQLEPGVPPGGGIYHRDGQTTRLVSKDDAGAPFPGFSSVRSLGSSADGSIVAFTTNDRQNLYVWSEQADATVKAVGPVRPAGGDLAVDSISADGRKIIFSTAGGLSANDTDTSKDLYEYDTVTRVVTLLSAPGGGDPLGNSDACATPLPGGGQCDIWPVTATDDASEVYFVSPERLVAGQGADGGANLYLSAHGAIRFIATLDPADPVFNLEQRVRHVRLTADGAKLIFESRAPLTGYDSAGYTEVYLYDSASGSLVCASCRPSGAAPAGDSFLAIPPVGNTGAFGDPPQTPANADEHGSRIFFNSFDAIVSKDANGRSDVYEYTVATRTPALLSSGTSERDSAYVGNGGDGRDVFFLTTDTLVPQDRNGNVYKMYDAREGGGFPAPHQSLPCQGAACHPEDVAPPAAPQGTGQLASSMRASRATSRAARVVVAGGARSVKGTSLRLTVKVSGPGRLSVSARGLVRASRTVRRATTYHLAARLSTASVAKLRRERRLALTATVRFASTTGASRSVRVRLTFTAPDKRNDR